MWKFKKEKKNIGFPSQHEVNHLSMMCTFKEERLIIGDIQYGF